MTKMVIYMYLCVFIILEPDFSIPKPFFIINLVS